MFKPDFQSQFTVDFGLSAVVEEHQNTRVGRDCLTTCLHSKAASWARGKSEHAQSLIFSECDKIDKINEGGSAILPPPIDMEWMRCCSTGCRASWYRYKTCT